MNWNTRWFFRVNKLVGTNLWLDAFGRAGAEWVVVAMVFWYVVSAWIGYAPDTHSASWAILFFGTAWALGWLLDVGIGVVVREPRPHVRYPESKLLFRPLMSWKSFPSDHAMTAWLIFFLALMFHLPFSWSLLPLALWVSWGRVYVGAHYPFDIVGGLAVAGFVAVLAWQLLLTLG